MNRTASRSLHRISLVLLVALTSLGAAACGGDDDGGGGGGEAVPKAQFVEDVTKLCEDRDAAAEALFEDFPTTETPTGEQLQELVAGFIPIIEDYREGVADAGPPEGLESEYEEYLELIDETLADFEDAADDPDKATALFEEEDDRFGEIEEKLGLEACAG